LTRLPVSRAEGRVNTLLHRLAQRLDELSFRQDRRWAKFYSKISSIWPI